MRENIRVEFEMDKIDSVWLLHAHHMSLGINNTDICDMILSEIAVAMYIAEKEMLNKLTSDYA